MNSQSLRAGYVTDSIAVADLNGDGIQDVAIASDYGASILLGNGDGTFTAKSSMAAGNWPNSIAVGDFNGDGIPDLAIANGPIDNIFDCTVTILLGNGDGTFTAAASPQVSGGPWNVVVGDFNGDGIPDTGPAR